MDSIQVSGYIDDQHRLMARVPDSVKPGPVTVIVQTSATSIESSSPEQQPVKSLGQDGIRMVMRNGIGVLVVDGASPIDPAAVKRFLEEEGF